MKNSFLSLMLLTINGAAFCMENPRNITAYSCDPQPCCIDTTSLDQELEDVYYDTLILKGPLYNKLYKLPRPNAHLYLNHEKFISWVGKKCATRSSHINPLTKE